MNTLALTLVVLIAKEVQASPLVATGVVVISLAAIMLCVAWKTLVRSYAQLNRGKFTVIDCLENRLPAALFRAEWAGLAVGRIVRGRIAMGVRRIYVSFDFDHDAELRGSFVAQAMARHSPHRIVDCFLPAAIDGKWTRDAINRIGKSDAINRIGKSDFVVFICGANTHSAKGVEAEMTITLQLGKCYFLLTGRRNEACSKPGNAPRADSMHSWSWRRINELLGR